MTRLTVSCKHLSSVTAGENGTTCISNDAAVFRISDFVQFATMSFKNVPFADYLIADKLPLMKKALN